MSSPSIPALALAMCLCAAAATATATAAIAAPPDPADARLTSAAPRPQPPAPASSAAVVDPGVGDWRQANRRVLEAGGWRALLRERRAASAPAGGHHPH
ncbi:hypothetical protein PV762_10900 [Mitsuaria sp. CC2]|jgi:hypothetical protein|uniref:hypothetical protein n=1 Tax=Mitsuaria sp. CC2 TaxID=3029186 RepID=UPI003B8D872B